MMNNDFQNAERAVHFQPGLISRKRKKRFVALVTVFVLIAATLQTFYTPHLEASAASVLLVGAGDIASCRYDTDEATAKLLDAIPGTVFAAGDLAYQSGAFPQFKNCYGPTWGRHKNRTKPAPGNHEYKTSGAAGYYQYFSGTPEYYAYDLGDWRIYALNSEIDASATSTQVKWLRRDLVANPRLCVLAYWHRPRWSSGDHHGDEPKMQALWKVLHTAGAELVINGHEHHYERFMPMNATGIADPNGMREIVVGTGGAGLYGFGSTHPSSEVRNSSTHGVLKLALKTDSYTWRFVPVAGKTFTDTGTTSCH
jgi:acid phosphatase type 7